MAAGPLRSTLLVSGTLAGFLILGPGQALADDTLAAAVDQCRRAIGAVDLEPLRAVQDQLLARRPVEPSLAEVMATAEALIQCEAPMAALDVLSRHSPAAGPDRRAWLLLQWRAADAGLDHRLAAQALGWLAAGDPGSLETLLLPVAGSRSGVARTRPALDLWADHLEQLGRRAEAAEVLMASRIPGEVTAARWGRAVAMADALEPERRSLLLERALELAAQSGAWGLVAQLLDLQLAGEGGQGPQASLALQRRLRLSGRIDDAYGEWLIQRRLGADPARAAELESQLRSPRDSGGHAAAPSLNPQP